MTRQQRRRAHSLSKGEFRDMATGPGRRFGVGRDWRRSWRAAWRASTLGGQSAGHTLSAAIRNGYDKGRQRLQHDAAIRRSKERAMGGVVA